MGGGGGKGGGSQTTTTKVELPKWLDTAFQKGLSLSEERAKMGYVPYTGPEQAAYNPMQTGAWQGTSDLATMFGMQPKQDVASMLPQAQDFAGGLRGYSSMPLYEQNQQGLQDKYPGLSDYLKSFFIDPVSGQMQTENPWTRADAKLAKKSKVKGAPLTEEEQAEADKRELAKERRALR